MLIISFEDALCFVTMSNNELQFDEKPTIRCKLMFSWRVPLLLGRECIQGGADVEGGANASEVEEFNERSDRLHWAHSDAMLAPLSLEECMCREAYGHDESANTGRSAEVPSMRTEQQQVLGSLRDHVSDFQHDSSTGDCSFQSVPASQVSEVERLA